MNQDDFEAKVLALWTKTRIPMTRANVLAYTSLPRKKAEKWLDELVAAGVLDFDFDEDGNHVWSVRGAARPASGATTIGDVERMERLSAEVGLVRAGASAALGAPRAASSGGERKSIIASGALSFFFGPLGWLYAAPLREALPAIAVYLVACAILPHFLLVYILGLVNAACALAGVAYAWSYNRTGSRASLFAKAGGATKLLGRRRLG